MKKTFMVLAGLSSLADGIPRIVLPRISPEEWEEMTKNKEEFVHEWVRSILSQWGNKEKQVSEFRSFRFSPESRHFSDAISLLLAHGFNEESTDSLFRNDLPYPWEKPAEIDEEGEEITLPDVSA